jgi:hypothetical protein
MAQKGINLAVLHASKTHTEVPSPSKIRFERAAFFAHVFNGERQR